MRRAAVPRLGVGAVYTEPLHPLFEARPDLFQVAEVEPSTFWIKDRGPAAPIRSSALTLERIAALPQAKLVHGVGFPIGGTVCDQEVHVAEQRRWAERLAAPWTSEHLSFNETRAGAAGFLLPPVQSEKGVALAARNIRARVRALGGGPFAFETGVNYLPRRAGEMPDGAYFAAVAEAADCLILLDLHNLWANERNGRGTVRDVVAALPLERVCEVHLAGGREEQGFWLDAHSGLIPPTLLDLAADLVQDIPALGAILFEISPQHMKGVAPAALVRQLERLHCLWERAGRTADRPHARPAVPAPTYAAAPDDWEDAFVEALTAPTHAETAPATRLYRDLIASFRNGALADLLPHTLRLLALELGQEGLEVLLGDYRGCTDPMLFPGDEALAFADWLAATEVALPWLADILALESGIVRIASRGMGDELRIGCDPSRLVLALAAGRVPHDLPRGDYRVRIGMDAQAA